MGSMEYDKSYNVLDKNKIKGDIELIGLLLLLVIMRVCSLNKVMFFFTIKSIT